MPSLKDENKDVIVGRSSPVVIDSHRVKTRSQDHVLGVDEITEILQSMSVRRRGKPPGLKCKGDNDQPCPNALEYSDTTAHLFVKNSKSRCLECYRAYARNYYH